MAFDVGFWCSRLVAADYAIPRWWLTPSRSKACPCIGVGVVARRKPGNAGSAGRIWLMLIVARSRSRVWKLCTGRLSGVRLAAALASAFGERPAGATGLCRVAWAVRGRLEIARRRSRCRPGRSGRRLPARGGCPRSWPLSGRARRLATARRPTGSRRRVRDDLQVHSVLLVLAGVEGRPPRPGRLESNRHGGRTPPPIVIECPLVEHPDGSLWTAALSPRWHSAGHPTDSAGARPE